LAHEVAFFEMNLFGGGTKRFRKEKKTKGVQERKGDQRGSGR
jgi:hypothetical protein